MNAEHPGARCVVALVTGLLFLSACDAVNGQQREPAKALHSANKPSVLSMPGHPINDSELHSPAIVDPVSHSLRFRDVHDEHIAIFTRQITREEDQVDGVVTDRIVLSATIQRLPATQPAKNNGWSHSSEIECNGVDIEADFYPATFSVTDLDDNGTAELTFAYHRFCGGGIDPRDVTVVLQEGGTSYVLEGQTVVTVGDDPPFGGGFEMDDALSGAPLWLQEKVLNTYQQVRGGTMAKTAP